LEPRRRAVIPVQAEDAMGRRWGTQLIVIAFPAGLLLYGLLLQSAHAPRLVGHEHQANLLQGRDRV
jgi:hypothetical protein